MNQEERNNEMNLLKMHQNIIEENVNLIKMKNKNDILRQAKNMQTKVDLTMDNKKQLEEDKSKKVEEIMEKQKIYEEKIEARKKEEEEINRQKIEERRIKDLEREIIKERRKRVEMMEAEKRKKEIEDKERKIKERKEKKEKLMKAIEKEQWNAMKQKQMLLKQLNQIKKNNKEINPEIIQNIFPEDKLLLDEVEKLKNWQKEEEKRQKLDNYQNESINFNVDYSYKFARNNNNNKTFITEKNNKSKIDKTENNNEEDEENEETDDNYVRNNIKLKKVSYIDEFNMKVRERNKTLKKIQPKSNIYSNRESINKPLKTEDTISLSVVKSHSINKNKSNLLSLNKKFNTIQNKEKKLEKENEKVNEKERLNYLKSRSRKRSKSPKNNSSLKRVNHSKFYTNIKIKLPEISEYKNITKNKSKSKITSRSLDKNKDNNNKELERSNSKGVLLTELNANAYKITNKNNKDNTLKDTI